MRALGKLVSTEVKQTLRHPPLLLTAIGLPVALAAVFGAIVSPSSSSDPIAYFFPVMGLSMGLGVLSFSLLPTALSTYRERGILRRLSTTPVPPSRLLVAQLLVNVLIALTSIVVVMLIVVLAFGFPMPREPVTFVGAVVLSTLALTCFGLFVASIAPNTRIATGIGVAFYFVNLVVGGVFIPPTQMPPGLAQVGQIAPLGAMIQSIQNSWQGKPLGLTEFVALGAFIVVLGGASTRLFRWE